MLAFHSVSVNSIVVIQDSNEVILNDMHTFRRANGWLQLARMSMSRLKEG